MLYLTRCSGLLALCTYLLHLVNPSLALKSPQTKYRIFLSCESVVSKFPEFLLFRNIKN